jgi:hypothetical protein
MADENQPKLPTTNDLLGIKSIKEYNKKTAGQVAGFYLKSAWYFNNWFEKLILLGLGSLGIWKILELIKVL